MMKRRMWKILLVILLGAALAAGGKLLYGHFVTDRITDKGGMENPFIVEAEAAADEDQKTENSKQIM